MFLVVLLTVLGGRLVQLQTFDSKAYAAEAHKQRQVVRTLPAMRGAIYDRSGTPRFFGLGNRSAQAAETNYTDEQEVVQARDRFQAGVANNIEVITAQDELSRANDNQIAALYRYNQSRADLAHAVGQMEAVYAK